MVSRLKKIAIILAGGTAINGPDGNIITVSNSDDVSYWLSLMPELSIMTDLQVELVASEDHMVDADICEKIAQKITNLATTVDGVIVVSRQETLVETGLALALMLQNFPLAIILTASQISGTDYVNNKNFIKTIAKKAGGLGLRSNLINAVQVASYKLPGPAIMFGTRLTPVTKAIREINDEVNYFKSIDNDYFGRVDFGINLKSGLKYRNNAVKVYSKISAPVLSINYSNGPILLDAKAVAPYQAIMINLANDQLLNPTDKQTIVSWHKPVVIYQAKISQRYYDFVHIDECTPAAALVKAMWAIANQEQLGDFAQTMKQNVIGEFYNS